MKDQELKYYREFAEFLQKYEESQEKTVVRLGNMDTIKLASSASENNIKNKLDNLA